MSSRIASILIVLISLTAISSTALAQSFIWPPTAPNNSGWSGINAGSAGPIPFGVDISFMSPNGDVYIGGRFGTGLRIAKWDNSNRTWEILGERLRRTGATSASLFDIFVDSSGDVYVGGNFTEADNGNGTPTVICPNIARWNANAATPAWEAVGLGTDVAVSAIVMDEVNSLLYIGGPNTGINNDGTIVAINGTGLWNMNTSRWEAVGQGVNSVVYDAVMDANNDLIICGAFDQVLGSPPQTVNGIVRWDGSQWHPLGQGFSSASGMSYPFSMAYDPGGNLVVGGRFDFAVDANGTQHVGPVVSWDGSAWQSLLHPPAFNVDEIAVDGGGNVFSLFLDPGFNGPYVNRLSNNQWEIVGQIGGEILNTISSNINNPAWQLYAGGLYGSMTNPVTGGQYPVINNSLLSGNGWSRMVSAASIRGQVLTLYNPGVNGYFLGRQLYAGGNFDRIAGVDARNIAVYDGVSWKPIAGGVNGPVYSVAQTAQYIIVGGEFSYAYAANGDSLRANNIVIYNAATQQWMKMGNGVSGPVYTLYQNLSNTSIGVLGEIVVGGKFDAAFQPNGDTLFSGSLAAYRFYPNERWLHIEETRGITGNAGEIRAFASKSQFFFNFYAAGSFSGALDENGVFVPSNNIAYFERLGPNAGIIPLGQGVDSLVHDIEFVDPRGFSGDLRLWVAGLHQTSTNGNGSVISSPHISMWYGNSNQWGAVGGGTDGPVYDVEPLQTAHFKGAFIGGDFSLGYYPNGNARGLNNVAVFSLDGPKPGVLPQWNARGDGTDGPVRALESFQPCYGGGEYLFVGGDFNLAGNQLARKLAKWKWLWTRAVSHRAVHSRSSGSGSGRGTRAVATVPLRCFPINENPTFAEVWFDSLQFGETFVMDSLNRFRPFDLILSDSGDPSDTVAVFDSLTLGSTVPTSYIFAGVDDTTGFAPNPDNRSTAIQLIAVPLPGDSAQQADVQVIFVHAATDAPAVNVRITGGNQLAGGLRFGDVSTPRNLPPGAYAFDVLEAAGGQVISTINADFTSSAGEIKTLILAGFLDPAANQNGPPLQVQVHDPGVNISTGIGDGDGLPVNETFMLAQNYPNPFNPVTAIDFSVPAAYRGKVRLAIFNILGQEVTRLLDNILPAGRHQVIWDGRDHSGNRAASGMYFYGLITEERTLMRKMLLVR